ncbi:MAG: WYL domain-containing transcriptional regulator [Fibrobacter sp.]|jgi:predicted DNA-binding transcriptional regulator YafY|nr:WYL domain-containing transcriptional regulator [Fibrobacter sp.]SHG32947.1 Predicted DNA-binding transcriptional regulator YafY, contains an HTH and WYL domains [Fibrobacter sp. UWCM]SHM52628.1 Predicted DNA-binding transcriptional regulator YafY, contains an HTH and WYL domains [Fibrobacter sp. UWR3]MBQ3721297.1 WYL domain-containing transcriptional regulator [Fibrobacter sp.]MBQ9226751.1 WYL domain-containing transcriptional regulator [Fibrobacter sp.]
MTSGSGYEKINRVKAKLRNPMSIKQLAEALNCSERTMFRHIEIIMAENCGLHKIKAEGETRYVIQTEEAANFNQDIVKKLEKLKKTFSESNPADVKNRKVVDKIIDMLSTTDPDEFKAEAVTLDPNYILDYGPFCDNHIVDSMVNKVLKAIRDGFKIRINYKYSARAEESDEIVVSPVKVIMRMDTLYLIAADDTYEETQVFKNYMFENIVSLNVTNESVRPMHFDPAIHYQYAFGKYTDTSKPQDVSLLIGPESKWLQTQFAKSSFHPQASLRMDKNKNMIVDLKIRITPDFKTWLLGVSPNVKILKPESLKADVVKMLKDALASMQAK